MRRFHDPSTRRGITLLEVVISMMVVAVGLLGLAALLPVGRYELAEATKYDRGSTLGRAAFRDLLVRGLLKPDMWLYVGGAPTPVVNGTSFQMPPIGGQAAQPPFAPVVIDPLLIAAPGNLGAGSAIAYFPYRIGASPLEASAPPIARVTVRRLPPPSFPVPLPLTAADRIFRSTDDLVFNIPKDKALDPLPVFHQARGLTGSRANVAARASQGDYSWIVTVAPSIAEAQGYPGTPGNAATTRQYSVCVVVLYKRQLESVTDANLLKNQNRGERLVFVDFLGMGSNTSSDARIRVMGMNNQQSAEEALSLKADQWIMVTGRTPVQCSQNWAFLVQGSTSGTGPATMVPAQSFMLTTIQWYRVISAADTVTSADGSTSNWYRSVKLSGRDFGVWLKDEDSFGYSSGSDPGYDPPTGYGTILAGAIGVYEKTMTTDGTSLWSY